MEKHEAALDSIGWLQACQQYPIGFIQEHNRLSAQTFEIADL
jgi:hypothetical protein